MRRRPCLHRRRLSSFPTRRTIQTTRTTNETHGTMARRIRGNAPCWNARVRARARPIARPIARLAASEAPRALDWEAQWYPVAFVEDLDDGRPTKTTLLGRDLVLWRDDGRQWRCFEDACPHRQAPLSEGRLENGQLQCTYHGWVFDRTGACTRIPQLPKDDNKKNEAILKQSKACCRSYPCQVAQNTVFVFAKADETLARTKPLPLVPLVDEAEYVGSTVVRELPYGWDTLVENVADPSHVPFAHHGIQGKFSKHGIQGNRAKAVPIPMKVQEAVHAKGATTTWDAKLPGEEMPRATTRLEYGAPTAVTYVTEIKQGEFTGRKILLHAYCVPIAPGRSKILFRAGTTIGGFPALLTKILPRWYDHIQRNDILTGDLVLLHKQERLLRKAGDEEGRDWRSRFYTPASADIMVNLFREWIDKYGPPTWAPGTSPHLPPELENRKQLLDLQSYHTDHCASCQKAQKVFQALVVVLGGIGLLLLGGGVALAANARLARVFAAGAVAACLASFVVWRAERRIFVFTDYVHAYR